MKIALINNFPHYSGTGRYAITLFNHLKKKIDVDYYFLDYDKIQIEKHTRKGIKVFPLFKIPFEPKILFLQRALNKIPRKYDIYHLSNQNLSFYRFKNAIITCHDIINRFMPRNIKMYFAQFFLFSGLKHAKKIISVSENTKKDLIKYLHIPEKNISVVYEAADIKFRVLSRQKIAAAKKKYNINPKDKLMLHISSKEPRKNYGHVLFALDKIPDAKLLNVGYTTRGREYRHLKILNRLRDRIINIGKVSDKEMPVFYNMADLLLFPSSYEGFGLPILEAMACGCPVIAYDNSSIPEVAGKAALLVNNKYELIEGVKRVLSNNKLKNQLITAGLKQARKFSWEKCARETIRFYKSII